MIAAETRPLKVHIPHVFLPLIKPARYKGIFGGRGSGKSHFMAEALLAECVRQPGTRAVCIREVQKTLKESSKRLLEDKLIALDLGESDGFRVLNEIIETPGGGVITFQGMQDHNAESIKSLEGFRIAWVEEAQTLSPRSLSLLRPTIRAENSELWFSWNPRRKTDAVDEMLRGHDLPTDAIVVQANYTENKRFPAVLEQERLDCLRVTPDQYDHIWLGAYATVLVGAYFARVLADAKSERRIGRVAADPLLPIRLFADIGGTGAKADAFVFWAAQFVGREVRVLDYYEAQGQPLEAHLVWLRERKFTPDKGAQIWLPHDGETHDKVFAVSYESALAKAGYDVIVVPNQGKGAAKARIEAVRRVFPACWFHEETTAPGIEALGWYHEKKDAARNVGLGPDHDWCFATGTDVLTPNGWVPINEIAVHNEVVTPCGNRRVIRSGIVRMTDKWMTTKGIRSTPEHRFFTKRGLVTAESLRSTDEFLTRDGWGLRILGLLCAGLSLGFMVAITSATREGAGRERQSSYIEWCTWLLKVKFRTVLKCITSTITSSITIQTTLVRCQSSITVASISQSPVISACAEYAAKHSGVIKRLEADVARTAKPQTTPGLNESGEPAYSLTVDRDECYFVRGDDGRAYLVANSSHGADGFGLLAICAEQAFSQDSRKSEPKDWRSRLAQRNAASSQAA